MDPHAVLGVTPAASDEEVVSAYRRLAKRHHPDLAGAAASAERMREINAAYAALVRTRRRAARRAVSARGSRRPPPGWWLPPRVARSLGAELLEALEPQETVLLVTEASTWDSLDVRLAVTDRRLLWLREDAFVDRIRWLRYPAIERVEGRLRRPLRRVGELVVDPRESRRVAFSGLAPDVLDSILRAVGRRLPVSAG